jgi:hypothetical protein
MRKILADQREQAYRLEVERYREKKGQSEETEGKQCSAFESEQCQI